MTFQLNISLCRICLQENGEISLGKNPELISKFEYTTQLKFRPEDGVTDVVCAKCAIILRIAYKFRSQALASDRHLRSFVSKVQNEFKTIMTWVPSRAANNLTEEEMAIAIEEGLPSASGIEEQHLESETDAIGNGKFECTEIVPVSECDETDESEKIAKLEFKADVEKMQSIEVVLQHDSGGNDYMDENFMDELYDAEEEADKEDPMTIKIKPRKASLSHQIMRRHNTNDPRPFECLVCHKTFRTHGTLKQHTYIHTGERPYKCKFCKKGFTQSKTLIAHTRIHTGEKPFKCHICGSTFRQKDNLKSHVATKHTGNGTPLQTFDCLECGKALKSKYSLRYHMEKVHN